MPAVSESAKHCKGPWTILPDRWKCPKEQCPWCKLSPLVYPFHLRCLGSIHQLLQGHKILEDTGWRLRCAEALSSKRATHYNNQYTAPTSLSLVRALQVRTIEIGNFLTTGASPLRFLLEGLVHLPAELQAMVFSFMLDEPGGQLLFDANVLVTLKALVARPEKRRHRISSNGSLFARWLTSDSVSYLAGFYDHQVGDCCPILPSDPQWDCVVVYWSNTRVTGLEFAKSDAAVATAGRLDAVQILRRPPHGCFWITMQVRNTLC
jgi:hypothetical protein